MNNCYDTALLDLYALGEKVHPYGYSLSILRL